MRRRLDGVGGIAVKDAVRDGILENGFQRSKFVRESLRRDFIAPAGTPGLAQIGSDARKRDAAEVAFQGWQCKGGGVSACCA